MVHDKTGKIIIVSLLEEFTMTACQKIKDEETWKYSYYHIFIL